jgi:PEP-CTERM motif/Thioester domain
MNLKPTLLGALLAVMTVAGAADAGQITNLQLYDGTSHSPVVTVSYTNPDGTGSHSAETYADPQVSGGTTAPLYYCIDLWHDNNLGSSYTITPASSISFGQSSTFSDVDNRLAWLVNQAQNTVDERAAVQLAMWYTIDNKGFSYSGGDATLRNDYNTLISFTGYDPSVQYAAQFWDATHDRSDTLYQNLISAVPEPSSILLAGVGMASALGFYAVRRRRLSHSAA